jgi:hypothetical protein
MNNNPFNEWTPQARKEKGEYPYWEEEFDELFKGFELIYRDDSWPKRSTDVADAYRVFMILCNSRGSNESRMDILNKLKLSSRENPIRVKNEVFWSSKQ